MLRRMATVVAATTALALFGAAPALAEHDEAPVPDLFEGNPTCDDVAERYPDLEGVVSFGKEDFNEPQPEVFTVDPDDPAYDGFEIFVIVKGGNAANVYFSDFTDMVAPNNASGKPAAISHVEVCGVPAEDDDDNGDNGDGDNGDGDNGDDKKTPEAEVPTEVPAGLGDSGSNTAGMIGLFAVFAGMAAGIAVLVRRRFVEGN